METEKNCPHEEIDYNEIPKCDLNKKLYTNTALKLHPDKNVDCDNEELINKKFQKLQDNKEYVEKTANSFSRGLNNTQKKKCLEEFDNNFIDNATNIFEKTIMKLSKKTKEINVHQNLNGELDLKILTNKGFFNIESIYFNKGNITKIKNIPEKIKILLCNDNKLNEIKNLPSSLEELYLSNNDLTTLDLSICNSLKKLHVSNNKLTSIIGLPITLEQLICTNNNLQMLDLDKMDKLKIFHCDKNYNLILKNIPSNITNIKLPEKIQMGKSVNIPKDYLEKLNLYFLFKNDYERELNELLKEKHNSSKKSNTKMPLCVGCKKNVGMIFSNKNRKYSIHCGGNPPCNWNMVINRGQYVSKKDVIDIYRKDVETFKEKIIQNKMKTLLKYNSDEKAIQNFEKELKAYETSNKYLSERMEEYELMYFSKEKKKELEKLDLSMNTYLSEVQKNDDVSEIVDTVYNKIKPISQKYQLMQYNEMYIDNYDDIIYFLIQNENQDIDKEINLGEEPSVKK